MVSACRSAASCHGPPYGASSGIVRVRSASIPTARRSSGMPRASSLMACVRDFVYLLLPVLRLGTSLVPEWMAEVSLFPARIGWGSPGRSAIMDSPPLG